MNYQALFLILLCVSQLAYSVSMYSCYAKPFLIAKPNAKYSETGCGPNFFPRGGAKRMGGGGGAKVGVAYYISFLVHCC